MEISTHLRGLCPFSFIPFLSLWIWSCSGGNQQAHNSPQKRFWANKRDLPTHLHYWKLHKVNNVLALIFHFYCILVVYFHTPRFTRSLVRGLPEAQLYSLFYLPLLQKVRVFVLYRRMASITVPPLSAEEIASTASIA